MTLNAKGSIRFKRDPGKGKESYQIVSKDLEIDVGGSGDIEEMIEQLTNKVREKFTEEFRTMPRSVALVSYSMNLNFEVVGPINHVLADFGRKNYSATVHLGDGTEIPLDKLTRTAEKVLDYAKRTGKTPDQVIAECRAQIAREKKAGKKGGDNP